MKKFLLTALCILLSLAIFAGCAPRISGGTSGGTDQSGEVGGDDGKDDGGKDDDGKDDDGKDDGGKDDGGKDDGGGDEPCVHSYDWRHNDVEHWQICTLCGDETEHEAHRFVNYACVCGAVEDAPPRPGQDTKNYYFVGHFGTMNWEQVLDESQKLSRLTEADEDGFTVYVGEITLLTGDAFKVVNDGIPEDFWHDELNYTHLAGGNAQADFGPSNHNNFVNRTGESGLYRVTLHTLPSDMGASFVLIDFLGGEDNPVTPHEHSFSELWTSNAYAHWHAATCNHDVTSGYALHTFVGNTCSVCNYTRVELPEEEYEFGDSISAQNTAFYKDYSEDEKNLYYTLWQESTSISVQIDITGYELAKINEAFRSGDTAKQDTYRKCNLTIVVNGTEYRYDEVGIRMRGNTSRRDFCDENGKIYAFVHFRFSLTETFDGEEYAGNAWAKELYHDWTNDADGRKERKDRSFATMEKFYYKWNKNYDQTYIREVYANRMFQAYGILAPHITLAEIDLKQGESMERLGVGGLYEIVDKQFIKRNFDKEHKGGDLYKCTYSGRGPADFVNMAYGTDDADSYCLKTNDDPTDADWSGHKYIKAFIDMLNSRQGDFTKAFEAMMSPDYFARFEACNYLAGNPDCIRNNYNNYYLYFTPEEGKAYLIPYDYDRCFGVTKDWDVLHGMSQADPFSNQAEGAHQDNHNPLYTRTILGNTAPYRALYADKLAKVLAGDWFTYEKFEALYRAYSEVYADRAAPSNVILRQCGGSIDAGHLSFTLGGGFNLTVEEYIRIKRDIALSAL